MMSQREMDSLTIIITNINIQNIQNNIWKINNDKYILIIQYIHNKFILLNLLNKNLPIKEEIQDFITMDKYETKNKILIFHNHQKIIVTFIFTVLSYIILINIYINRNRFWKILIININKN